VGNSVGVGLTCRLPNVAILVATLSRSIDTRLCIITKKNTTADFQNAFWLCFLGDSLHQGEEKGSINSPFLSSVISDVKKKPHEVI